MKTNVEEKEKELRSDAILIDLQRNQEDLYDLREKLSGFVKKFYPMRDKKPEKEKTQEKKQPESFEEELEGIIEEQDLMIDEMSGLVAHLRDFI